ncbi:Metallo-dependent phosphatase-like protein [Glomus cerebriforme]|uniref:Metallo-dependent phosphatase-like protein n=1 Tax=Glomus cerebriforme TaxID=658196 RepID=A0A397SFJ8_9GLOM|nr:Metallo-dependent phosphatase-like protein [Glomus cerebriforme]
MQQPPQTQPSTSSIARSCANNILGIFRFPFIVISKITQKLLSPVKRNQRRNHNRSPAFAFKIIWTIALLIGEVFIFSYSMRKCSWPEHENWNTAASEPVHVAIIADPQIIDDYSYGRTGILQKISEIYPDMYMRKNWINLQNIFDPDAIIFLGDLMDGGRELDDNKWDEELHRFRHLFLPEKPIKTPTFYLAGNHDIGFGNHIVPEAFYRFRKLFGVFSYMTNLGNHSIIALDTITLSGSNNTLKKDARKLMQRLEKDTTNSLPRILLTHVPLYRPPNTDCGPLRQKGQSIKQGAGYQYQNLIVESLTNNILENIKPILIFSGDDHDYCEIRHEEANGIPEISVNSFSFAMGVSRPGFLLLSLYNPLNLTETNFTTFAYSQCLLPNQIRIYIWYIILFIATISCIFSHAFFKLKRNAEILPIWHRYHQKRKWIVFNSQYWKIIGKEIGDIALIAFIIYLICWIWFLV